MYADHAFVGPLLQTPTVNIQVYDLGQPSWSHPVDRITATSFICAEAAKYLSYLGRWPLAGTLFLPPAFAASLWTFSKSWKAVDDKDAQGFFFWHGIWHLACAAPNRTDATR